VVVTSLTLRDLLPREGHMVMAVPRGAEALAAVPKFRPDVLVIDIHMPGLSGPQGLDALRSTGRDVPVIAISSQTRPGVGACLGKPLDVRELQGACLSKRSARGC
jgi:CheY-like chemotaxis protein